MYSQCHVVVCLTAMQTIHDNLHYYEPIFMYSQFHSFPKSILSEQLFPPLNSCRSGYSVPALLLET